MTNYHALIANALTRCLQQQYALELSQERIEGLLETPKNLQMGDLAFPCFQLAKELRKAPPPLAQEIALALQQTDLPEYFSQIAATGPFINFKIDRSKLAGRLLPQILAGQFQAPRSKNSTRVMVEYSQPNTHKAFHVGHTRNVALGDSLVRLYEWAGYEVVAANYIGDVGAHIAKCLWYLCEHFLPTQQHIAFHSLQDCVRDLGAFKAAIYEYCADRNQVVAEFLGDMYAKATELLDFYRLAKLPFLEIISVQVQNIQAHPKNEEWLTLQLSDGRHSYQVVCGSKAVQVGQILALAKPGARVAGRLVSETTKDGVLSQGMVLSEKELELNDNKETIFSFPAGTALGVEVCELTRNDLAESQGQAIGDMIRRRNQQVSSTLKELETPGSLYYQLWQETRDWSMQEFYKIYAWLDSRFDHYFYESDVGDSGKQLVQQYLEKGVFERNEGAIGIRFPDAKLPFFLLLKSDGTGLYSTKDIALAKLKFEKFQIDKSIYVVDVGQSLHFQQVFACLDAMGFAQAKDCFHLAYGMVVLPDGKMSSRKGNVIYFSQLREALEKNITEEFLSKYQGQWSDQEIAEARRRIAIATIKYGMLNQDNNKNIVFDLKEWTAKSGNTGPYMMYAYARIQSILRELKEKFPEQDFAQADYRLLEDESEQVLLRKLSLFPEAAQRAVQENQPQLLCIYQYELAKDFSRMYSKCSVLKAETPPLREARASLVKATGLILQQCLSLIGIECIERM